MVVETERKTGLQSTCATCSQRQSARINGRKKPTRPRLIQIQLTGILTYLLARNTVTDGIRNGREHREATLQLQLYAAAAAAAKK